MPVSPATNTTIPTAFPAVAATATPDVGLVGDVVRRKVRAVLWPLTHDTQGAPSFGTETLTRTSVANVADWEGIYRAAASGEEAFQGGRRVENLVPGDIVSDSDFRAGGSSAPTVTQDVTYKGRKCVKIEWQAGSAGWPVSRVQFQTKSVTLLAGHSYISSMRIAVTSSIEAGTALYDRATIGNLGSAFSLSQNWTKISVATTTSGTTQKVYTPTTDDNVLVSFWWVGGTLTNPITMYITDYMVEEVSGQASTVPSEFVAPASVRWINYKNGNQLTSGVVTEAQGATLIPDGMLLEDAAKNQITAGRDLTDAAWTKRGTVSVTLDTTVTNASGTYGATKITGLGAGGSADVYQFTSALAAGAQRVEPQCLIKKITSTGSIAIANPVTASDGLWVIDLSLLGSGWERITRDHAAVSITNEFQSNATNLKSGFQLYRSAAGTYDLYVDLCTIETDSSDGARAFSTSPIETTTGSAIRAASDYSFPVAGNFPVNDMTGYVEWTPASVDSTQTIIGTYVDSSNLAKMYVSSGGTLIWRKKIAGTLYSSSASIGALVVGQTYKIAFRLSSVDGIDVFVDGVKGTGDSNTDDAILGTNVSLNEDGNSANLGYAVFRKFKIIDEPLSDAECINLTS